MKQEEPEADMGQGMEQVGWVDLVMTNIDPFVGETYETLIAEHKEKS